MPEEKNDTKIKFNNISDFDFLLKQKVVEFFDVGISKNISNDLKGCFESFKSLLFFIGSYDYADKDELAELTKVLTEYFDTLQNQPGNRKDEIILANEKKAQLRELLDIYMSEIPKAFANLGLWFNTVTKTDDMDLMLSEENFNNEFSMIKDKKKKLSKLSSKTILDLMSTNSIHDAYAKLLFQEVMENSQNNKEKTKPKQTITQNE